MQEILINIEAGERRVAILREKKLEWYFVERISKKRIVGNVYKGAISSVLNGMGAAFVDCGLEKNGFLYVDDITAPLIEDEDSGFFFPANGHKHRTHKTKISEIVKKGQDVLVQITKEPLGTKGARLTTHISLPGRYLVLMPTSKKIGVSRRIKDDDERKRIKALLQSIRLPKDTGVVARTAAQGCGKKEFTRDIKYLLDTYNKISAAAKKQKSPVLLFEEFDIALKVLRDFLSDDTTRVVVDEIHEFKRLKGFVSKITPSYRNKLRLHKEPVSLFEKYNVEKEIDKLFERKIYLKCGGFITIEQTEGMIAIDVNSGRFTGKKNLEDTIFKVNKEAAVEIARQLRLRDIGGIIIIDFIDMEISSHKKEIYSLLQNALEKDKARTNIISFSELNIVEMTRQRVRKSLQSVSYENCPYCDGRGMVKSDSAIAISALRKIKSVLKSGRSRRLRVEVVVHPRIAQRLVNDDSAAIEKLKRVFKRRISIVSDDTLHVEDVNIRTVN